MNKRVIILFPCVGRRVALAQAFRRAARRLGLRSVLVGTDVTEDCPALQCCDRQHLVKPVTHRDYPRQVSEIVRQEQADLLVPTVDLDLMIWARRRKQLADVGCTAVVSTPAVVRKCQDKRLMFTFFREHGFDTPLTWTPQEALDYRGLKFPCFLKSWDGHASLGNEVANDRGELRFYTRKVPNCIVQEFIKGQEHTVDVFVDFDGRVRCLVPRRRLAVRAGEVSKGVTIRHAAIMAQTKRLIETLRAGPGVITVQCFLTSDEQVKFIEVNPRFGGGAPLSIKAGADFPRWLLALWLGREPHIAPEQWREGLTMLRYDDAVWLQKPT